MEEDGVLVAGVIQSHLSAISSLLSFYERHLWNFVTPSAKRTRQIVEIQLLIVKVQPLSSSKMGAFTSSEIGYEEIFSYWACCCDSFLWLRCPLYYSGFSNLFVHL